MAAKTYNLNFDGYWRALNVDGLPPRSGIYCVFACTHNTNANTVSIRELLYIGESANVRSRVSRHERWEDWERRLLPGEELGFNAALIGLEIMAALIGSDPDRQRAEAAMIYRHKPPCNTEFIHSFSHDQTTISISGARAELAEYCFTVNRTPQQPGGLLGRLGW